MTEERGRQPRQQEERAQRRRRSDVTIDGGQRLKLAVPPEVEERMKREGRSLRWINDEGNRMHNLTRLDDYDKVAGVAPVRVGTAEDGKPILAHLCSKPTAFLEEDKAKLDERRKETERALLRGRTPGDSHGHDDKYSSAYVDEASKITHGGGLGPP